MKINLIEGSNIKLKSGNYGPDNDNTNTYIQIHTLEELMDYLDYLDDQVVIYSKDGTLNIMPFEPYEY